LANAAAAANETMLFRLTELENLKFKFLNICLNFNTFFKRAQIGYTFIFGHNKQAFQFTNIVKALPTHLAFKAASLNLISWQN